MSIHLKQLKLYSSHIIILFVASIQLLDDGLILLVLFNDSNFTIYIITKNMYMAYLYLMYHLIVNFMDVYLKDNLNHMYILIVCLS